MSAAFFRLQLGQPRADELDLFRRAANLQLRWGSALMRTGDVSQRIWGAQRLSEAMTRIRTAPSRC